jgi:hypothetical protein
MTGQIERSCPYHSKAIPTKRHPLRSTTYISHLQRTCLIQNYTYAIEYKNFTIQNLPQLQVREEAQHGVEPARETLVNAKPLLRSAPT